MRKQVAGVAEEILSCAEAEFLEKGFAEASLRRIAEKSGVSTSSIYTRFGDKAGLFEAVVDPVVSAFSAWFTEVQENFHQLDPEVQVREMFSYSMEQEVAFVDYIYDHLTVFQLLTMKAEGTKYLNFINDLVDLEVAYTVKYIEAIGSQLIRSGYLSPELMHILSSGYYTGIFETVIHGMSREAAHKHTEKLRRFYASGWRDFFAGDAVN